MKNNRIVRPLELRSQGNVIEGVALRYGDIAEQYRETFVSGAFGNLDDGKTRWLNFRHDKSRVIAHTGDKSLVLNDTPEALEFRATLPDLPLSKLVKHEISEGRLNGASIEFNPVEEKRENGLRVVERATLNGIGLTPAPAYRESRVEIRQAGVLFGRIPFNTQLSCECYRGSGNCNQVSLDPNAIEFVDEENLIAVFKSFATPLASVSKGTLRYEITDEALEIILDIPETTWGRDLVETAESVPVLVRPLFDADDIEGTEVEIDGETVAKLSKVPVRAILVGSTPNSKGWPEAEITPSEERGISRRRRFAWL